MKCSQNNKQINNRKQYSKGVESATDGMVIMLPMFSQTNTALAIRK